MSTLLEKYPIQNQTLKDLYSKFKFLHLSFQEIAFPTLSDSINNIFSELLDILESCKFITYQILNLDCIPLNFFTFLFLINQKKPIQLVNAFFCTEKMFLVLEQIELSLINEKIEHLKKKSLLINSNLNFKKNEKLTSEEKEIKEEINNFCHYFQDEINNNKFVKDTISTIACFLIRRFFYPTDYFFDPSFFIFDKEIDYHEHTTKRILDNMSSHESLDLSIILYAMFELKNHEKGAYKAKYREFQKKDFIILRDLLSNDKAKFSLVIHIKSFYIFLMKVSYIPDSKEMQHEINFCENYSHRCFRKFYGFIKEKGKVSGFIYQFLSNGTLDSFIRSQKNKIDDLYLLMTIYRLIQGIYYLHSNSLIHRDLKPINILIDHNFIPYIADYDSIRLINKEHDDIMTNNLGSILYTSPEQDNGGTLSYSTDIYSFGLIIYFLYQKENAFSILNPYNKIANIPLNINAPERIISIYQSCIKLIPTKRMKALEIKLIIEEEINSLFYIEQYIIKKTNVPNYSYAIQYFIEMFFSGGSNFNKIFGLFITVFFHKMDEKYSELFLYLGNIFFKGIVFDQNYLKAKDFYELAAKLNNSDAICNLGILYSKGYGVEQDYSKALKYYELSAKQNNSEAFFNLGVVYFNGEGVKQDYLKAIEYYELSAKQNNSNAFLHLGMSYRSGEGVEKNYLKSRHYYKLAAKMDNPYALFNLGMYYYDGEGVDQNYLKAIKYFEKSAKLNYSSAFYNLGHLYFHGEGVQKDINKGIEYYELSAKQNNIDAINCLGKIYQDGVEVVRDYLKSKKYYEIGIQLNDSNSLYEYGKIYQYGLGVNKDVVKAINYYKLSANKKNPHALHRLGEMYYFGIDIEKNQQKGIKYFELSAKQKNPDSLYILGLIFLSMEKTENHILIARDYFELAAKEKHTKALFYLGYMYSNLYFLETDLFKAINYFMRCSSLISVVLSYGLSENQSECIQYNQYRYISLNNLGLIYLFDFDDNEKSFTYIQQSAFGEYSFAQNNYGLIKQLYMNCIEDAKYMYLKSAKQKFALAEYNLGYLKEKESITESIKYYKMASELEDESVKFHTLNLFDKRLDISKTFILSYTNLKLADYYFSKTKYNKSKMYFIKSFAKLNSPNYQFKFHLKNDKAENIFSYLKTFILFCPIFDLSNQSFPNIRDYIESFKNQMKDINNNNESNINESNKLNFLHIEEKKEIIKTKLQYFKECGNIDDEQEESNIEIQDNNEEKIYNDQGILFDDILKDEKLKVKFVEQIKDIINTMKTIIYLPPYPILFGRINIHNHEIIPKPKEENNNNFIKNINKLFYEGFELDINKI